MEHSIWCSFLSHSKCLVEFVPKLSQKMCRWKCPKIFQKCLKYVLLKMSHKMCRWNCPKNISKCLKQCLVAFVPKLSQKICRWKCLKNVPQNVSLKMSQKYFKNVSKNVSLHLSQKCLKKCLVEKMPKNISKMSQICLFENVPKISQNVSNNVSIGSRYPFNNIKMSIFARHIFTTFKYCEMWILQKSISVHTVNLSFFEFMTQYTVGEIKVFKDKKYCLKFTKNVSFEFVNFGIFHQFMSHWNLPVW